MLPRLVARGVVNRPGASVIGALAVATAALTAQLALTVAGTAANPWERTFAATHGAHVIVRARGAADLSSLRHAPGVVEAGRVRPVLFGALDSHGSRVAV